MVTYIVGITAKPGSADEVKRLFAESEARMQSAPGFGSVIVYRATPSAPHGGEPSDGGTHFISIETWDTVEARAADRQSAGYMANHHELVTHLLPAHSHDYYDLVVGGPVLATA